MIRSLKKNPAIQELWKDWLGLRLKILFEKTCAMNVIIF